MINPKYSPYLFAFLMALFMSGIMSMVITLFNLGLIDGIILRLLKSWIFSFCIAFPVIIVVAPLVRKLVSAATRQG